MNIETLIALLISVAFVVGVTDAVYSRRKRRPRRTALNTRPKLSLDDRLMEAAIEQLHEARSELNTLREKYEAQLVLREVDQDYVKEARAHFIGVVNALNHLGYEVKLDGKDVLLTPLDGDDEVRLSSEVH